MMPLVVGAYCTTSIAPWRVHPGIGSMYTGLFAPGPASASPLVIGLILSNALGLMLVGVGTTGSVGCSVGTDVTCAVGAETALVGAVVGVAFPLLPPIEMPEQAESTNR